MHIDFIEIQNFRKLKSVRTDLAKKTTVFVGANNSGKTSAMVALGHFLIDQRRFTVNDFTLSNWTHINGIGVAWETAAAQSGPQASSLSDWETVLPSLDVWLQVESDEIHYVTHLLPKLDWQGGLLGVRLRLEPKDIGELRKEYCLERKNAQATLDAATQLNKEQKYSVALWPTCMRDFLERRLTNVFTVRAYSLDPTKCANPKDGLANPQPLPEGGEPIDGDPFDGLMYIKEIDAQRGFQDASASRSRSAHEGKNQERRKLSAQLRSYYTKHLDPSEFPEPSDLVALEALEQAKNTFDERLKVAFASALQEVENLGYPGVNNPQLTLSTRIHPTDGLDHAAAVQYQVAETDGALPALRLPEDYNGLGYQNLISIVFDLMSFRDDWMQVGKATRKASSEAQKAIFIPPLQLILVEEPEAHLHAQVQQVFINKAYDILRAHPDLGEKNHLSTQLVVSTHSSHIAHECDFSSLRYFRRMPSARGSEVPTSTVVNLSEVFGKNDDTERFVARYLKTTHCDLFFADAAILVEGPAERILLPNFIRTHFPILTQSYISLLEIGGSHAHTLRPLIEHLGLTTLIITDLDAADPTGRHEAKQPVRGQKLITRNATLKGWLPQKELVDDLLDAPEAAKENNVEARLSVRVAYQSPTQIELTEGSPSEALSNTFEDALVFENLPIFKDIDGTGLARKFKEAISEHKTSPELGEAMFQILRTGNKAQFALDLLFFKDLAAIKLPTYIQRGLGWLQDRLNPKGSEAGAPIISPVAGRAAGAGMAAHASATLRLPRMSATPAGLPGGE